MPLRPEIDAGSQKVQDAPSTVLATSITNGDTTHAPDGNAVFDALYANFRTQATAAGTTTLVVGDAVIQAFTGTTTQTVVLPVTSTLTLGRQFLIINNSTGVVTVNSSGGNLVQSLGPGTAVLVTCVLITGTTAASWDSNAHPSVNAAGALLIRNAFSATVPGLAFDNDASLGLTSSPNTMFMVQNGTTMRFGFFGSLQLSIPGTYQYTWAAADPQAGLGDTGLARVSAGKVRITNGGAGLGQLVIGGSTPASATATGTAGTITWDADFIYICTATDTWKRVAIATW